MKIKRLYIKDFGIFREQQLKDLSPGVIVIGGPNRAGKTTLLHVLRYLWYGFPPGGNLPPATRRYEVEVDITDGSEEFNLYLEGYAKPKLTCNGSTGKKISHEELFRLDAFTYHRLFTISLDELRNIPAGVDDTERLQSILLGAGLGEIVMIPQLEEELNKRAHDIGRTRGNPRYGSFTPYYRQIEEGIKLRREALNQINEYEEKKRELELISNQISTLEEKTILELEDKYIVLDVLKNNYLNYQEKERLRLQLDRSDIQDLLRNFPAARVERVKNIQERYHQALEDYNYRLDRFRQVVTGEKIEEIKDTFLQHRDEFRQYTHLLSGLRERVNNYFIRLGEHCDQRNEIYTEMKQVNSAWDDFEVLKEIRTDRLEQDTLNRNIVNCIELQKEQRDLSREIEKLEGEKELLERQLATGVNEPETDLRNYFILSILFALVGAGLSLFNVVAGLIIGLAGIIGTAFFLWKRSISAHSQRQDREQLRRKLEDVLTSLDFNKKELEKTGERLSPLETQLRGYRRLLGVDDNVSPEMVRVIFSRVRDLKEKLYRWEQQEQEQERNGQELDQELKRIEQLLQQFTEIIDNRVLSDFSNMDLIEERIRAGEKLLVLLEEFCKYCELAVELDDKEQRVREIEKEIYRLLEVEDESEDLTEELKLFLTKGEDYRRYKELEERCELLELQISSKLGTERVRKALKNLFAEKNDDFNDERMSVLFAEFYSHYTSLEDVENDYRETEKRLHELKKELEGLKGEQLSLQEKLEELATTKKLEEAQRKIDEARAEIKPLAEKYAVYRVATFILGQVRTRFMDRARDTLLDQASKVLKKMTGGEYVRILPPDNLLEADFQALLHDGRKQGTVNILSRGTREQLFLAIRVSRLREIEPPLPVIVDDSLVNFDRYHLDNTVEILLDLARTHQLFILTCHPHLVECIAGKKNRETQYWKLEEGNFTLSTGEELIKVLSK